VTIRRQRPPDPVHRPRHGPLGDDLARPDAGEQLVLGDHAAGLRDEIRQHLEHAGLEAHGTTTSPQLVAIGRHLELAEPVDHRAGIIDSARARVRLHHDSVRIAACRRAYSPGKEGHSMPKFVIERDLPGAGRLSPQELQGVAAKSNGVLRDLGPEIQWVHSYVTDDKIYCVYVAPNAELIREHAKKGGFPANKISEIKTSIDPTTAEAR
jgi:hypothetical protein